MDEHGIQCDRIKTLAVRGSKTCKTFSGPAVIRYGFMTNLLRN